ncbi:MAG: MFS transporter [Methyloligellaceae bacterium]
MEAVGPQSSDGEADPLKSHVVSILLATTIVQTFTTWANLVFTPAATVLALEFNLPATAIGYQVGLVLFSAMCCSLVAGSITIAIGARLTLQLALLISGLGAIVSTFGGLAGIICGSVLIGLGYGLTNPPSAVLLARATSAHNRGLIFSLKQSGVPLGGVLAAIATPYLTETYDWRVAAYAVGGVCLASLVVIRVLGQRWGRKGRFRPARQFKMSASLKAVLQSKPLSYLTFAAMAFVSVQMCVMTFVSPFLVKELGFSLIAAGVFLATAQVGGTFGRPFWGSVADRIGHNALMMRIIGAIMTACLLLVLGLSADISAIWLYLLFFCLGASAIGWNGIFLAEIADVAGPDKTSQAVSGAAFFTFLAGVVAPSLFALAKDWTGSYALTIAILSAIALCGLALTFGMSKGARSRLQSEI